MNSEDKTQTHKQFKDRENRIEKGNSFENKKNVIQNDIEDIDQKIKELTRERQEKYNQLNIIDNNKYEELIKIYNNPQLLAEIMFLARKTTYSISIINDMEERYQAGINVDDSSLDTINTLIQMEQKINKEIPHTNYIADILNNFGDRMKLFDKGGDDDDD